METDFNRSALEVFCSKRKSPKRQFRAFKMNFGARPEAHNCYKDFIAASGCLQGRIFAVDICHMPFLQNRFLYLPPLLARASLL
jgi:hypothetical protein